MTTVASTPSAAKTSPATPSTPGTAAPPAAVMVPATPPSPLATPAAPAVTVPWSGRRVDVGARAEFGFTLPTRVTTAPACRLAQLAVVADNGPAMGTVYGGVRVHNTSGSTCALHGAPRLELVGQTGTVWQSTSTHPHDWVPRATTVVLVPGSWAASSAFVVGASCGGEGQTARIRVSVPGDPAIRTLPFHVGTNRTARGCIVEGVVTVAHPRPGQLDTPPFAPMSAPPDYYFSDTTQSIAVRQSVRVGDTLTYRFLVTAGVNGACVGGSPGPLFRHWTSSESTGVGDAGDHGPSYELWTAGSPATCVKAGETIAFSMRLELPPDTPAGPARVYWRLVEPVELEVSAAIDVLAR